MPFKNYATFSAALGLLLHGLLLHGLLLLSSCQAVRKEKNALAPSSVPEGNFHSIFNVAMENNSEQLLLDPLAQRVQHLSLEPFAHIKSYPLPFSANSNQSLVRFKEGGYFVTLSQADFAITTLSGTVHKNPVTMPQPIMGFAFHPDSPYLCFMDTRSAMAILQVGDAGEVLAKWFGGLIDPNASFLGGAMTSDGHLLLATSKNELLSIDLAASLAASQWVFEAFALPSKASMTSLHISQQLSEAGGELALLRNSEEALVWSVAEKQVKGQIALASKPYPHGVYQGAAHFYSYAADGSPEIHYLDASATLNTERLLHFPPLAIMKQSYLDGESKQLLLRTIEKGDQHNVWRYSLNDAVMHFSAQTPRAAVPVLTPNYLLTAYQSPLGFIERQAYVRASKVERIEGFNAKGQRN